MNNDKQMKYWLAIAEKYFDATATAEEEKALASFLATEESNVPEFNEIKAVMGYLATARHIEREHVKQRKGYDRSFIFRWTAAAAAIAIIAVIGADFNAGSTSGNKETDIYIANINGNIYTDKDFVLEHMYRTMDMIGNTTKGNSVDEQLESIFNLTNN